MNGDGPVDDAADQDEFPDEVGSDATALSADDGDRGTDALGLGLDQDQVQLAEEDDELDTRSVRRARKSMGRRRCPTSARQTPRTSGRRTPRRRRWSNGRALPASWRTRSASSGRPRPPRLARSRQRAWAEYSAAIPAPILTLLELLPGSDPRAGRLKTSRTQEAFRR
jgi:hypothetical protein